MNRKLYCLLLLCSTFLAHAAKPLFNIVPFSGSITAFLLPNNFTETVQYQVTNQSSRTRTLTMLGLPGVTQTTSGNGLCSNPFTLASNQSCILTLVVQGAAVPSSGISRGPVICATKSSSDSAPDLFLCSEPSRENTLAVSVTTKGQHAYIANQLGNSISLCQVNPASGYLSQCSVAVTGLGNPEGIGFNPQGSFFYASDPNGNYLTVCKVNQSSGALTACMNAQGSGFDLPNAIAFSPDGTILYTSNLGGGGSVSACLVDATTGELSSCIKTHSATFGDSAGMSVNSEGTLAYVVNRSKNTTSVCNLSGQNVSSCNDLSGSGFSGPEGVILSALGMHAYITNATAKNVLHCDVGSDGLGLLEHCTVTDGAFAGTGNIALNDTGTFAYVPNEDLSTIFLCAVNEPRGLLSACKPARGSGFIGPSGIVVQ